MSPRIEIYTQKHCPWCHRAKALFKKKNIDFKEIMAKGDSPEWDRMIERTGGRTTPQILIDGEAIGGYTELAAMNAQGILDENEKSRKDIKELYEKSSIFAKIIPYKWVRNILEIILFVFGIWGFISLFL